LLPFHVLLIIHCLRDPLLSSKIMRLKKNRFNGIFKTLLCFNDLLL
jgi:hypothetical protein